MKIYIWSCLSQKLRVFYKKIPSFPSRVPCRRGRRPSRRGRQHTILSNFLKNCMKSRKFWAVGGGRAGCAPPKSATAKVYIPEAHYLQPRDSERRDERRMKFEL